MKVLVNKRHGTFEKFAKEVLEKLDKVEVYFKELFTDEDLKNTDVVFVASKFPQVEKAKRLIYLQIVFPTDREKRQKILDKMDQDYKFYLKYLNENCNVVVEIVRNKKENKILETYTKQFFIFKPNRKQDIFKRMLLAFEKIKIEDYFEKVGL